MTDKSGAPPVEVHGITAGQLRSYVERVERLNNEKAEIGLQITAVLAEAKANGFDAATIREVIRLRKLEPQERAEKEEMIDLYLRVLGMKGD